MSGKTRILLNPNRILTSPQSVAEDMRDIARCAAVLGPLEPVETDSTAADSFREYIAKEPNRFEHASLTALMPSLPKSCHVFYRHQQLVVRHRLAQARRYAWSQVVGIIFLLLILLRLWKSYVS